MKKRLLFALFFIASATLFAQNRHLELGLSHNWNFLDRDAAFTATHYWGANGLRAGVHYYQHTSDEHSTWENARALTPGQRWGFSLAFERRVKLPDSDLELYPYVSEQLFKLSEVFKRENAPSLISAPYPRAKTALGLLGKVKLYRQFYLQGGADLGAVWEKDPNYGNGKWQFDGLGANISLGLQWRLF